MRISIKFNYNNGGIYIVKSYNFMGWTLIRGVFRLKKFAQKVFWAVIAADSVRLRGVDQA
jgi:hypothetical protein